MTFPVWLPYHTISIRLVDIVKWHGNGDIARTTIIGPEVPSGIINNLFDGHEMGYRSEQHRCKNERGIKIEFDKFIYAINVFFTIDKDSTNWNHEIGSISLLADGIEIAKIPSNFKQTESVDFFTHRFDTDHFGNKPHRIFKIIWNQKGDCIDVQELFINYISTPDIPYLAPTTTCKTPENSLQIETSIESPSRDFKATLFSHALGELVVKTNFKYSDVSFCLPDGWDHNTLMIVPDRSTSWMGKIVSPNGVFYCHGCDCSELNTKTSCFITELDNFQTFTKTSRRKRSDTEGIVKDITCGPTATCVLRRLDIRKEISNIQYGTHQV